MAARTLENCRLIKEGGKPDLDNGKCIGFASGLYDDEEPCETCKKCKLNSTYDEEAEYWITKSCGC